MNRHIKAAKDLETTYAAKRAGFLEIALRKNKEALPYIDEAKALKAVADQYSNPNDLAKDEQAKVPLAEAAGISTKAKNYLDQTDIDEIVIEFISNFLAPAGNNFVDELVYRYLLSKGDALGGRMRNIVGAIAGEKLTRFLAANLRTTQCKHQFLLNGESKWHDSSSINMTLDMMGLVKAIRWGGKKGALRELIYNINVPIVTKNIDISIFNQQTTEVNTPSERKAFLSSPTNYVALGELKGGIDPAGADEHWKTANTALQRIRASFKDANHEVQTFFVGGAIEASMAREIFAQYENNELNSVANLTNDEQLAELCAWLINL